jgi:hypothetical protein
MSRKKDIDSREIKSRASESRSFESREAARRVIMNMEYEDPLHIPREIIPDDVDYFWVRESILGEPDTNRMVEMKRKGWTPVPADRHPDMVFDDFFGRLTHVKGFIFQKGLILCERPKYLGQEERKRIEQRNYQIMQSMPGTENFLGEPSIPAHNTSDTYMCKSASFGE